MCCGHTVTYGQKWDQESLFANTQVSGRCPGSSMRTPPPTYHCDCREPEERGAKILPSSGCGCGMISQEVPGLGVFYPSFFHPGLWGSVPWADLQSLGSWVRQVQLLLPSQHILADALGRPCAGRRGSGGKASPPPQGAHLRGTDRYLNITSTGNVEAQECAARSLHRTRRGARRRSASIQLSIPGKLSGWPARAPGTRILPSPHLCLPSPVHTRWMLFCTLATRGRVAPCRNRS